jgi:hypothetical protein
VTDNLQKDIITKLAGYGQQGCSVNELFRNIQCSKTDFIRAKNRLIKDGLIIAKKEGRQKKMLSLNPDYLGNLDSSFYYILKGHQATTNYALKRLKKLKPLFRHTDDKDEFSGVKVTNQNVAELLQTITSVLESISEYTMIFTLRSFIDPDSRRINPRKNQKAGFDAMQKIIQRLLRQHKDEEEELRKYMLWGMVSSFSYVA